LGLRRRWRDVCRESRPLVNLQHTEYLVENYNSPKKLT
jgi:hypothetical protein